MKLKYVGTEELFLGCETEGYWDQEKVGWVVTFSENNHPMYHGGPHWFKPEDWQPCEAGWLSPEMEYFITSGSDDRFYYWITGDKLFEAIEQDTGDYPLMYISPSFNQNANNGFVYFSKCRMVFESMSDDNCVQYPLSKVLADWLDKYVGN